MGPTGVGKTEIARRLARLANSPFLKVEATKFTEIGYVGRDVESMVRDLMELAVNGRTRPLDDAAVDPAMPLLWVLRDLLKLRAPDIECDGEMHGDAALSESVRRGYLPETTLTGSANLLVLPNLDAANILFNVLKMTGGLG